ncbi:MAG: sigma-70 family RNA polymerase sigma factor [Rikenellaceae bacterium]|nr:sigma-70 family RNA polymerase sigma factor [Rikenellaceae bacterium]
MNSEQLNIEFLSVKDAAYRYAVALLHDRSEAEDAVQDLYERLWRRRLLLRRSGFRSLVMTAIRNAALDRQRERERRRCESVDEAVAELVEMDERRDEVALIKRIIARLPEREREVIHLRDVEGMAFEDIAEMVGCSEVAARMAHSRARQKVKDEFSKIMNYGV